MYMTRTGIYINVQTCMYICLFVITWYIHVHTMYVHVWHFLTCMYMLNTCLYRFSNSCPCGQDSRCGEPAPAGPGGNCQPDSESLAYTVTDSDSNATGSGCQCMPFSESPPPRLPVYASICQYMPVYASICKYMRHVYARICRWSGQKTTKCEKHVCARICTYMHVYECIWKYDGIRYRKCPFSVSPPVTVVTVGCTQDVSSSWLGWSATAV